MINCYEAKTAESALSISAYVTCTNTCLLRYTDEPIYDQQICYFIIPYHQAAFY